MGCFFFLEIVEMKSKDEINNCGCPNLVPCFMSEVLATLVVIMQ